MAARKTSEKPTRIWKFGARPPAENAERVYEILELSSRYFERLTAIERGRHRRYQRIRREALPELAAIEHAYDECRGKIRDLIREAKESRQAVWRTTGGKRTLELPPHIEEQIQSIKAEMTRLSEESKPHRDAFEALLAPARKEFVRRAANLPQQLVDRIEAVRTEIKGLGRQVTKAKRAKSDDLSDLLSRVDRLSVELAELNARKRALTPAPRIKERLNEQVLSEMLGEDWPKAWKEIAQSGKAASDARKKARAECALPPGVYLQVETAFERAKTDALPEPPRYYSHVDRFDGRGKIAVQLGSETFADILSGASNKLQLVRSLRPGARGKQDHYWIARLQIARSTRSKADHLWASFPVKLDRLPPDDAVIKWAWVTVRKRGERRVFELQLTMEHESFAVSKRPAGSGDGGHIRIGWGSHPDGICVAKWEGGDVVIPHAILEQGSHASIIRGHADEHFHSVKRALRLWLRTSRHRLLYWDRVVGDAKRLQFRKLCTEYAAMRLGRDRLRELWQLWRAHRFDSGRDLFAYLRVADRWIKRQGYSEQEDRMAWWLYLWTRKDAHLRQYAADSMRRFDDRREQFFRNEAIRIATQHETVTVDKYNIAQLKKLPELTTAENRPNERAQRNLQLAAPGRFREVLLETMGDRCARSERPSGDDGPGGSRKGKKTAAKSRSGLKKEAAEDTV